MGLFWALYEGLRPGFQVWPCRVRTTAHLPALNTGGCWENSCHWKTCRGRDEDRSDSREKGFIPKSKSTRYRHLHGVKCSWERLLVKECLLKFSISKSCNWPHCQCHTTEQSTCRDQIQTQPEKEYMTQIPPPSKNKKLCTFPICQPPTVVDVTSKHVAWVFFIFRFLELCTDRSLWITVWLWVNVALPSHYIVA